VTASISHSLVKALRNVHDFASLEDRELLGIVGASTNLAWPAGARIFEKGSESEALYIILSGTVRVYDEEDGRQVEISRIGPGDSFGELSIMLRTTHTKVAEAVEDTELMVVPKESFEELLETNSSLSASFQRRLAERRPVRGEQSDAV
jgi:CRP/FNR family cyclic AMP-dependent transcriptional regulator